MNNRIDLTSYVSNLKIGNNSYVYKNCRIIDSSIGNNSFVGDNSVVKNSVLRDYVQIQRNSMLQYVEFGDYSYCGMQFTSMHSRVGKYCSISWNVTIGGGQHNYNKVTTHSMLYMNDYKMVDKPLYNRFPDDSVLENDIWVGSGAIILQGVKIGNGAVIAAGSVVTKDVPPYCIVAGVPAKTIKYRCDDSCIERLLKLKWWDFPPEIIKENIELLNSDISSDTLDILETIKESIE